MQILKQSTAVTVKIGPFIDPTAGTPETGLTILQANVRLSINGGNMGMKTEASACTHDEIGVYDCPLDATDTGTLGRLQLYVNNTSALPVFHEFLIVKANIYDTICSTDYFDVNLVADQSAASIGLTAAAVDAICDEALSGHTTAATVGQTLTFIRQLLKNKRAIVNTTETTYADDNTTPLQTWTLDSATTPTSRTPT